VEVRQIFTISKVGTIAGSFVADGKVARDASVRVVRDGRVVHEGKIASLRRFKDDVREVLSGQECGIGLVNYNDIHQGDVLEVYGLEEVAPKL
jgi:translation initiation factor IF-2